MIFPTLCLSSEEARLFIDDPVEFIRKVHDPMEDFMDPRVAATNLLQVSHTPRPRPSPSPPGFGPGPIC